MGQATHLLSRVKCNDIMKWAGTVKLFCEQRLPFLSWLITSRREQRTSGHPHVYIIDCALLLNRKCFCGRVINPIPPFPPLCCRVVSGGSSLQKDYLCTLMFSHGMVQKILSLNCRLCERNTLYTALSLWRSPICVTCRLLEAERVLTDVKRPLVPTNY